MIYGRNPSAETANGRDPSEETVYGNPIYISILIDEPNR
jgi:hypothetical protein